VKSPKGHRLYRHEDVETVRHIKHLLYDEGFTIAGARRHLSEGSGAAAAQGHAAQTEDNFGGSAASPDARPDRDFRRPQVEGAPAPLPPESELPGTQELSGARLSAQSSTIDRPAPDRAAGNHPVADATIGNRAVVSDRAAPDRAAVDRAAVDHATVGRAIVDRKVLLDLRDALRSLLTLLETE
jgi:DNA-binding transcriptional MerR regulator